MCCPLESQEEVYQASRFQRNIHVFLQKNLLQNVMQLFKFIEKTCEMDCFRATRKCTLQLESL